jgi:hypothetical protein
VDRLDGVDAVLGHQAGAREVPAGLKSDTVALLMRWDAGTSRGSDDAVASPQGHVQRVREDRAPEAVDGLLGEGESRARAF